MREGYELTVTTGPDGASVRVPGHEPIPLLAAGGGTLPLEGLASTLRFDQPETARLRQGTQEWKLDRL